MSVTVSIKHGHVWIINPAAYQQKRWPFPQSTAGEGRRGKLDGSVSPGPGRVSLTARSQRAAGHQRMDGLFSTNACKRGCWKQCQRTDRECDETKKMSLNSATRNRTKAQSWREGANDYFDFYLDVKLQIALVHLSGNHALYHMHRHKLVALICWTEDIMSISLLNLYIEEPEKDTHTQNWAKTHLLQ